MYCKWNSTDCKTVSHCRQRQSAKNAVAHNEVTPKKIRSMNNNKYKRHIGTHEETLKCGPKQDELRGRRKGWCHAVRQLSCRFVIFFSYNRSFATFTNTMTRWLLGQLLAYPRKPDQAGCRWEKILRSLRQLRIGMCLLEMILGINDDMCPSLFVAKCFADFVKYQTNLQMLFEV